VITVAISDKRNTSDITFRKVRVINNCWVVALEANQIPISIGPTMLALAGLRTAISAIPTTSCYIEACFRSGSGIADTISDMREGGCQAVFKFRWHNGDIIRGNIRVEASREANGMIAMCSTCNVGSA